MVFNAVCIYFIISFPLEKQMCWIPNDNSKQQPRKTQEEAEEKGKKT
jgi:hypothetical protein